MNADLLSNEELLGLHDVTAPVDSADASIVPNFKAPRKVYRLTDDLMLGPRGVPALMKSLGKFRFKAKKHHSHMTGHDKYLEGRYDHSVHFENLTRLLHVYQLWGHEVYPKYRLKDFIPVASRAASSATMREWKRQQVRDEVDEKIGEKRKEVEVEGIESVEGVEAPEEIQDTETQAGSSLFVTDEMEEEPLYTLANEYAADKNRGEKEPEKESEETGEKSHTSECVKNPSDNTAADKDKAADDKDESESDGFDDDDDILKAIQSDDETQPVDETSFFGQGQEDRQVEDELMNEMMRELDE